MLRIDIDKAMEHDFLRVSDRVINSKDISYFLEDYKEPSIKEWTRQAVASVLDCSDPSRAMHSTAAERVVVFRVGLPVLSVCRVNYAEGRQIDKE